MAQEADLGAREIDALRGLEELYDRGVALDLEDLAAADLAARQLKLAQLVVGDAFHLLDDHQRIRDLAYGFILSDHSSSPPSAISATSAFISSMMPS